jgi:hypothetical protein
LQELKLWGSHHWKIIRLSTRESRMWRSREEEAEKKQRACGSNQRRSSSMS